MKLRYKTHPGALSALVLSSICPLQAAFVYNENSAMIYHGAAEGADAAINPNVVNDGDIGIGSNATGSLTVNGGSLTLNNTAPWAPKIGSGGSGNGTITVNAGSLTIADAADNEARFTLGNGDALGTINLNGGTITITIAEDDDSARGFRIGVGGNSNRGGTINLNSGTFFYPSTAVVYFGALAGGPQGAYGIVNVQNGLFEISGTSTLVFGGTDDYLNFITGGTGGISVLGWGSTDADVTNASHARFKALIDTGKVRIDGSAVAAGDYTSFAFSDAGNQGVMKLGNATLLPPAVLDQPDSVTKIVGQPALFEAQFSGNPLPTLQWEMSVDGTATWTPITGATASSYQIPAVTYAMNGYAYRIVATNSQDVAESSPAFLTVEYPAPVIVTQPASDAVLAGGTVTFGVAATGFDTANQPLAYQWEKLSEDGFTWLALAGETADTLTISGAQAAAAGTYSVDVTDPAGAADAVTTSTRSSSAILQILNAAVPEEAISWNVVGAAPAGNPFGGSAEVAILAPADPAGVLDLANWNNSSAVNGVATQTTPQPLTDDDGDSTAATVTWASSNTWAVNPSLGTIAGKTPDQKLMHGYIERRSPNTSTVAFNGIPYGTYDVYVYFTGGVAGAVASGESGKGRRHRSRSGLTGVGCGGFGKAAINGRSDRPEKPASRRVSIEIHRGNGPGYPAGVQIVKTSDLSPYGSWALANANGQPSDQDFDGDGVENGIEYFMGLSGSGFTANPVPVDGSISWIKGAGYSGSYGTDYVVQTSVELDVWTAIDIADPDLTLGSTVTYDFPSAPDKRFFRLMVTAP